MTNGFDLLNFLDEKHVAWLLENSHEENVAADTVLVAKDTSFDSIFFVIKGLLHVYSMPTSSPKILGPGEIIGEISFLDEGASTANVIAKEDSMVLRLAKNTLKEKLKNDQSFAADFYHALALIIAKRFRYSMEELNYTEHANEIRDELAHTSELAEIFTKLQHFKNSIVALSKPAEQSKEISSNEVALAEKEFSDLFRDLNEIAGPKAALSEDLKKKIGKQIQAEMLPYILLTKCASHAYVKPRGYAGDYEMIDLIYKGKGEGIGPLGPIIDQFFQGFTVCDAVRNRRNLLKREITNVIEQHDRPVNIASFACGPAAEIFDVYATLEDKKKLHAVLLDFDMQALAHDAEKRDQLSLQKNIDLLNENLIYLALGRKQILLPKMDLVYSIGLIDYFEDNLVIKLINFIYDSLSVGGKVILGNFHPRNPDRILMEDVLEWYLIHRNEQDMNRLFESSKFKKPCDKIQFEEKKVNLFAECTKST